MKRVLVLLMVLGVATVANAALTFDIYDGATLVNSGSALDLDLGDIVLGKTYTLDISGTTDLGIPWSGGVYPGTSGYFTKISLTNPTFGAANGDLPTANPYDDGMLAGWELGAAQSGQTADVVTNGVWFAFDMGAVEVGAFNIAAFDYAVSLVDPVFTMTGNVVVPEPVTIALLGLGGLLLRRRK